MRNLFFGFLIILAAAVVTGTAGAHSSSRSSAGSTANTLADATVNRNGVACTISTIKIRKSGNNVVAGGRFVCDSPGPDLLNMLVHLERRNADGSWSTISAQRVITHGRPTTRSAGQAGRTIEATAPCAAGTYRTGITAYTVSRGKTHEYAPNSATVKNPC